MAIPADPVIIVQARTCNVREHTACLVLILDIQAPSGHRGSTSSLPLEPDTNTNSPRGRPKTDEPRLPPPGVLPAASGPPPLPGEPPGAAPLAAAAASASSRAASSLAAVRMLDCGCVAQAVGVKEVGGGVPKLKRAQVHARPSR